MARKRNYSHVAKAGAYRSGARGWIVRRYLPGYGAWEPEEDSLRVIYPTRKEAREALARVHGTNEGSRANARLIAAAPELLSALEGILPHVPPPYSPDTAEAIQRAYAALQKARG